MRIVGGDWRGRTLLAPEGRDTTRPTTDRTREGIASMLLSACGLDLSGVRVLDAFAGSGALGLELLSRGAEHATFVERNRKVANVVRRNIKALGADSRATLVTGDAFRLAERGISGGPFGIVLLDPPYATPAEDVAALVKNLAAAGSLTPAALVLYERAAQAPRLPLIIASTIRERSYGDTSVDLLRLGGNHDPEL